jgi:hypothetical protein
VLLSVRLLKRMANIVTMLGSSLLLMRTVVAANVHNLQGWTPGLGSARAANNPVP